MRLFECSLCACVWFSFHSENFTLKIQFSKPLTQNHRGRIHVQLSDWNVLKGLAQIAHSNFRYIFVPGICKHIYIYLLNRAFWLHCYVFAHLSTELIALFSKTVPKYGTIIVVFFNFSLKCGAMQNSSEIGGYYCQTNWAVSNGIADTAPIHTHAHVYKCIRQMVYICTHLNQIQESKWKNDRIENKNSKEKKTTTNLNHSCHNILFNERPNNFRTVFV